MRRQRLALQNITNISATPSLSDVDHQMPQSNVRRRVTAKVKSIWAHLQPILQLPFLERFITR